MFVGGGKTSAFLASSNALWYLPPSPKSMSPMLLNDLPAKASGRPVEGASPTVTFPFGAVGTISILSTADSAGSILSPR